MTPENPVDLYNNVYSGFRSDAELAVRRQTYGEDIGQSSWMTASEWLRFADLLGVTDSSEVLEVGSGSGGPAIYLVLKRGCRVTGVDINEHGVRNAVALAADRGVPERVDFRVTNAGATLPFPAGRFDAIVSNDAMCHIEHRLAVLREKHRETLIMREGPENFEGLQRFLCCVHTLSTERRLSRNSYLAQKK